MICSSLIRFGVTKDLAAEKQSNTRRLQPAVELIARLSGFAGELELWSG